jgi:hypothetical protein
VAHFKNIWAFDGVTEGMVSREVWNLCSIRGVTQAWLPFHIQALAVQNAVIEVEGDALR